MRKKRSVVETSGIVGAAVYRNVQEKIATSNQDKGEKKMGIEQAPVAALSQQKSGQGRDEHKVLDEGQGVIGWIVFSEIGYRHLPRQSEITVKREPPQGEQREVQSSKAQIAASGHGMRPQCQGKK